MIWKTRIPYKFLAVPYFYCLAPTKIIVFMVLNSLKNLEAYLEFMRYVFLETVSHLCLFFIPFYPFSYDFVHNPIAAEFSVYYT